MGSSGKVKRLYAGCLLAMINVQSTAAAVVPGGEKPHWNGETGLGYVATTGNTRTSTFNAKADLTHEQDQWRNNLTANMLYTQNSAVKTAEKYFVSGQSNYRYSGHMSLFSRASYEDDRFSGYEYQGTATVGLGHRFLAARPSMTLDVEAGAGIKAYQEDGQKRVTESVFRLAGKYVWNLREKSKFSQELSSDIGKQFTVNKSITSLTAQLLGNFAINLGYTVKYTSRVPANKKKIDTETTINLVYVF